MTTVYLYKLWCITEGTWKYVYGDSAPTVCPTDTSHTIDTNSITIEEIISPDIITTRLSQTDLLNENTAITVERGFNIPVTAGETISSKVESFPFDIDLVAGFVQYKDAVWGDYIEISAMPLGDASIGTLAADALAGDTVITVDNDAYQNLRLGNFVLIGTDTTEYRITSMDDSTNQLALESGLSVAHSIGDSIKMRRKILEKYWINTSEKYQLGMCVPQASGLSMVMQIEAKYFHAGTTHPDGNIYLWLVYRY